MLIHSVYFRGSTVDTSHGYGPTAPPSLDRLPLDCSALPLAGPLCRLPFLSPIGTRGLNLLTSCSTRDGQREVVRTRGLELRTAFVLGSRTDAGIFCFPSGTRDLNLLTSWQTRGGDRFIVDGDWTVDWVWGLFDRVVNCLYPPAGLWS